jgi:hypothetical protein
MIDVAEVVAKYIELRDRKAKMKADYEASIAPITEAMDRAEAFLLNHMNSQGVQSAKTAAGTAYIAEQTSVTIADGPAFMQFVRDNDAFHLLDNRASKKAVEEYVSVHQDLPPGLNYRRAYTVNIRRS